MDDTPVLSVEDVDRFLRTGSFLDSPPHKGGDGEGDEAVRRSRRTEIERISRRRRQAALRSMRDEVRRLERRIAVLTDIHAAKSPAGMHDVTAALAVDGAQRLREAFIQLKLREDELKGEQQTLQRCLHDKTLLMLSLRSLTTSADRRWHRTEEEAVTNLVSMAVPEPLPVENYYRLMTKALAKTSRYDALPKYELPGSSCMGWTSRRHQSHECYIFSLSKRFENCDVTHMVDETWGLFSNEERLRKAFGTWGTSVQLRVVQQISDDILVLHRMSNQRRCRFTKVHVVYLLFRVQTPDGIMLCLRSVRDHVKPLDHPHRWSGILTWIHFRQLDPRTKTCEVVYNNYAPNKHRHCGKNRSVAPSSCRTPWPLCGKQPGRRFSPEYDFVSFASTVVRWELACVTSKLLLASDG